MNFAGKNCGICGTKLEAIAERVAEGVSVDAFRCAKGHVSYSEEVMRMVEALSREGSQERRIVKVGSSLAITIPSNIVKALGLKSREKMYVTARDNTIIIRPSQ